MYQGFLTAVILSFAVAATGVEATATATAQPAVTDYVDNSEPAASHETFRWINGPARTELGDHAEIFIPEGYRFANANDASIMLRLMNNPVPKTLVGLITPTNGAWFVIFEFNETGFVKYDPEEELDPIAILKTIRTKVERQNEEAPRIGAASIALVNWELKPEYDAEQHSLEWALRAESGPQKVINHVVRLLGRHGVLDGIAVQPAQVSFDTIPLKRLMKGVSFKPGETYADYRKGDPVSKKGLAELITTDENDDAARKSVRLAWIIAGSAVFCSGALVIVIWRRKSHSPGAPAPAHTNGKRQGMAGNRAPRAFDYQRFYADLMLQVSEPAYHSHSAQARRRNTPATPGSAGSAHSKDDSENNPHLQLIAEQKILIGEQQRLIREQARLIEEKTRLIQEKSQLIDKQAELFGNSVF